MTSEDHSNRFQNVTHVIFDVDGLLVDSEKYYSEALIEVAQRYGKTFDYQIKLEMMGELFKVYWNGSLFGT